MATAKCEIMKWVGMAEARCNRPVAFILDANTKFEMAICEECAEHCDESRLTQLCVGADETIGEHVLRAVYVFPTKDRAVVFCKDFAFSIRRLGRCDD